MRTRLGSAESLDAAEGRSHDAGTQASITTNRSQQFSGYIRVFDAAFDAFTNLTARFEKRFGAHQDDDRETMCQIVREFDGRATIDVLERDVDQEEIEGFSSDLGGRLREVGFPDDFEGAPGAASERSPDPIRELGPLLDEEDADELFVQAAVFGLGTMACEFCGRTHSPAPCSRSTLVRGLPGMIRG
jgi:hypothetical protein